MEKITLAVGQQQDLYLLMIEYEFNLRRYTIIGKKQDKLEIGEIFIMKARCIVNI